MKIANFIDHRIPIFFLAEFDKKQTILLEIKFDEVLKHKFLNIQNW